MATRVVGSRPRWLAGRPRINPNHPLAFGLWFYVPSYSPGHGVGSISWVSTPYGPSMQTATTSSGWAVAIPNLQTPVSEFTFLTVQSASSRAASSVGVGVAYDNSAATWATPWWVCLMAATSASTAAYFHFNNAGTVISWTMPTTGYFLSDKLYHVYLGTAGVSGSAVYRDGAQFSTSATGIGASAITPSRAGPSEVMLMDRSIGSPGEGMVGICPVVAIWTRKLAAAEIALISADPFCLLL